MIRVFDIAEVGDGCPWIVMELLPRRSLREVIEEDGPLSPAGAARVGLGVLAALRAAHAEGIVHRDVKPANILMAPGRVVLADFGIARAAGTSELTTAGSGHRRAGAACPRGAAMAGDQRAAPQGPG